MNKHCTSWTYNTVRVQKEGSTECGHHCIFYLVHRCAGYSMTDVTRLLENPVEATTIVQNFVLLLVKHVLCDLYVEPVTSLDKCRVTFYWVT